MFNFIVQIKCDRCGKIYLNTREFNDPYHANMEAEVLEDSAYTDGWDNLMSLEGCKIICPECAANEAEPDAT